MFRFAAAYLEHFPHNPFGSENKNHIRYIPSTNEQMKTHPLVSLVYHIHAFSCHSLQMQVTPGAERTDHVVDHYINFWFLFLLRHGWWLHGFFSCYCDIASGRIVVTVTAGKVVAKVSGINSCFHDGPLLSHDAQLAHLASANMQQ